MTDRPAPDPSDDHPDVTALLASDPAPPIPGDVADRLRSALREESEARAARDRPRVVTPIEAARRRRRVVPVLAAAAVVVGVVAVGVPLLREGQGGGDEMSSSAGSAADSEAPSEPGALAAPESDPGAGGGADEGRRLADAQEAVDTDQAPAALPSRPGALTCTDDQLDVASRLAVSYQGDLAWLVTVPAAGGDAAEYVVYGCEGTEARRLAVVRPAG